MVLKAFLFEEELSVFLVVVEYSELPLLVG